jgi:hypothetical protein
VAAALMGEEIGPNLVFGVAAVLIGIWVAASEPAKPWARKFFRQQQFLRL